jgi:acetyl esterase/lipase
MTREGQIGPDRHSAPASRVDAKPGGGRRGGDTGSPNHGAAVNARVADRDAVPVAAGHHGAEPYFDPEPYQSPRGPLGKSWRKARQQARAAFDQNDAGGRRVDMPEVAGERRLCQFGERAGELDPEMAELYLGGADPRSPLAAPIYADLKGLAPLLIQVGAAETLLDDGIRLAKAAGAADVRVDLQIWPEMVHVWHMFHPELTAGKRAIPADGDYVRTVMAR